MSQLSDQGVYLSVKGRTREASCPSHGSGYPLSVSAVMPEQVEKKEEDAGPSRRDGVADDCEPVIGVVRLTRNPPDQFALEQQKDLEVQEMMDYLVSQKLPNDVHRARRLVLEASLFAVVYGLLYYVDPKRGNRKRAVVPKAEILSEVHAGRFSGHFSGRCLYGATLISQVISGYSRFHLGTGKPPLQQIPVSSPFQILGIDVHFLKIAMLCHTRSLYLQSRTRRLGGSQDCSLVHYCPTGAPTCCRWISGGQDYCCNGAGDLT